jgi:hypothetical protein
MPLQVRRLEFEPARMADVIGVHARHQWCRTSGETQVERGDQPVRRLMEHQDPVILGRPPVEHPGGTVA